MQSQTEEECTRLARILPPTEAALLDWAINLMADVAQFEDLNKMNARNVAMVFAPNMTHVSLWFHCRLSFSTLTILLRLYCCLFFSTHSSPIFDCV